MLAAVKSGAVLGIDGILVHVEVDVSNGLPNTSIVGLGDTAVQESKERVKAAIRNSGLEFPARRITVNLAPADLRKAGPAFDLAIAVGILAAGARVPGLLADASGAAAATTDETLRELSPALAGIVFL
ncbi:MAG: magnesium chelatase, partial [Cyanobacteria bacterium REEB65]|nr:magnesium chelatase [Cyanobacteria bacterium REEB65]